MEFEQNENEGTEPAQQMPPETQPVSDESFFIERRRAVEEKAIDLGTVLLAPLAIGMMVVSGDVSRAAYNALHRALPRFPGSATDFALLASGAITLAFIFIVLKYIKATPRRIGFVRVSAFKTLGHGFLYSVGALLLGLVVTAVVVTAVSVVMVSMGHSPAEVQKFFTKSMARETEVLKAVMSAPGVIYAVIIAPVLEETVFRGLLYGGLRRFIPSWIAACISAGVFAGLHFYILGAPAIFIMGIVACRLYDRNNSLAPCIAMHSFWNMRAFVFLAFRHFH